LELLAGESPSSVRSAAIAALSSLDLEQASRFASDAFAGLREPEAIDEIFSAFLQRQGGAAALAKALMLKTPPKEIAAAGLRMLAASGRREEELARVLSVAAGFTPQEKMRTPAEIAAFVKEVRLKGNAARGGEVFRRPELGCVACHAVNGQGGHIGPELSTLGSAQPVDFIVGAIIDPQKEIKEGYMSLSITTKEGEEYTGYQVRETADELVLRDVLQNKEIRLRRDAIKEKMQNGSVMPRGLTDALSRAEFCDLVRFLSELGKQQ
jgi:putative heme-binding domain-containing protein